MSIFKVVRDPGMMETFYEKLIYITRVDAAKMNYIYGTGVSVIDPYGEMMYVKECYGQEHGKAYFHYIFSPEQDEEIELEKFYEIGVEMSEYIAHFHGHYQLEMALHFDTDMHMHFIANNIDIDTGTRMNLGKLELRELKCGLNKIVDKYNVSLVRMYYPEEYLE